MTDNMKQHSFGQTEARTANIGIANSGGWTLEQSAAVILLCCGSGLDE